MSADFLGKETTTSMKGLAILLITISHMGDGFQIKTFVPLGGIGVALFLILSGYGLMESYKRNGLIDFWKKRVMRVLIPYFLWVCAFSAYRLLAGKDVTLLRYWFVEYIVIWYVVFYLSTKFLPNHKWIVFSIAALLLYWFLPWWKAQQSLSFIAGMLISVHRSSIMKISTRKYLLIGCFCILVVIVAFGIKQWGPIGGEAGNALFTNNVGDNYYQKKLAQVFIKLPVALTIIIIMELLSQYKSRLLYAVGLVSYELYLVQITFYTCIASKYQNLLIFCIEITISCYLLYICDKNIIKVLMRK
jgi:Predicted acyltransferases